MTNIYVVCKNDIFYKAIQPALNENNFFISRFFKMPSLTPKDEFLQAMKNDFLACTQKPEIVLMDANWNTHEVSGKEIIQTFSDIENLKIIVSTTSFDKKIDSIFQSMGATSYMVKLQGYEHILNTIKTVFKGNSSVFA